MKIFVINLKKDTKRLELILDQFKKLNITNFEIVEAVYGKDLTQEELNLKYESKSASRIVRELSPPEIGCALSHIKVYHKIIKENKRCLILEDDVIISDTFKNFIDIEIEDSSDIIFFGATTSNCEHEKLPKSYEYKDIRYSKNYKNHISRCYLEKTYATYGGVNFYDIDPRTTNIDFLYGNFAYAPSVAACQKLIKYNYPVKVMADFVWNYIPFSSKIAKENIIEVDYSIDSHLELNRQQQDCNFSKKFVERVNNKLFNK